jgi:uncharacterized protein (TIGR02996 family)
LGLVQLAAAPPLFLAPAALASTGKDRHRRNLPMLKLYHYVGPEDIRHRAMGTPAGLRVRSASDLEGWVRGTGQVPNRDGLVAATFVVDPHGFLRVADRASEHVACAGGNPVRSAGEMFLRPSGPRLEVAEVSNQSTGYCPEPESWAAVTYVLHRLGVPHPDRFTPEVIFRRCLACGQSNVVKDNWFACGLCGADLPRVWNFWAAFPLTAHDSFLLAIIEDPDDVGLRLAFADWLDEQGQPDRADFLRVQCQRARLPEGDGQEPELAARERALLAHHTGQWLGGRLQQFLAEPPIESPFEDELRQFAAEQKALPLMTDMGGCFALRLDGEIISFAWDEPGSPGVERDTRVRQAVLFQGARKYPELRLLLPPRPAGSRECPRCQGAGAPPGFPSLVCYCGGLGWLP